MRSAPTGERLGSFDRPFTRKARLGLAEYTPNHFLIRLSADAAYFELAEDLSVILNDDLFPLFLHEYTHYWQNISTVAGAKGLVWSHYVLAVVSAAYVRAQSDGADEITFTAEEARKLEVFLVYRDVQDGGQDVPTNPRVRGILDVRESSVALQFPSGTVLCPIVTVVVDTGASSPLEYQLGSIAVEEGAAILVQGQFEQPVHRSDSMYAPELPYRIVERLFEHIVGGQPQPFECLALSTLALQCSFPGAGLLDLLRRYAKMRRRRLRPEEAIERVIRETRDERLHLLAVVSSDLLDLVGLHRSRGAMEDAMKAFTEVFARASRRRRADPIFDARGLTVPDAATAHANAMSMISEFLPCDSIQEREGPDDLPTRDFMVASDAAFGPLARVLQCQQHFMLVQARLSQAGSPNRCCPLYGACDLPMRQESPDVCRTRPWQRRGGTETCAYGVGAGATSSLLSSRVIPR